MIRTYEGKSIFGSDCQWEIIDEYVDKISKANEKNEIERICISGGCVESDDNETQIVGEAELVVILGSEVRTPSDELIDQVSDLNGEYVGLVYATFDFDDEALATGLITIWNA